MPYQIKKSFIKTHLSNESESESESKKQNHFAQNLASNTKDELKREKYNSEKSEEIVINQNYGWKFIYLECFQMKI